MSLAKTFTYRCLNPDCGQEHKHSGGYAYRCPACGYNKLLKLDLTPAPIEPTDDIALRNQLCFVMRYGDFDKLGINQKSEILGLMNYISNREARLIAEIEEQVIGKDDERPMPQDEITNKQWRDGFSGGRNNLRKYQRAALKVLKKKRKETK